MNLLASILGFAMMIFGIVVAFFIVFHVTTLISFGICTVLFKKKRSMFQLYSITALFFIGYIAFGAYIAPHKDEPPNVYNTSPVITYDDDTIDDGKYNNEDQCFDNQGSYGC